MVRHEAGLEIELRKNLRHTWPNNSAFAESGAASEARRKRGSRREPRYTLRADSSRDKAKRLCVSACPASGLDTRTEWFPGCCQKRVCGILRACRPRIRNLKMSTCPVRQSQPRNRRRPCWLKLRMTPLIRGR